MTLAILCTYLFDARTRPLVEIHLEHIRRNTSVPFRIYASVTLLDEAQRAFLEEQPDVVTIETGQAPVGSSAAGEHQYHLDTLRKHIAADTDVTRLLTVHADSFPIRSDWVSHFDRQLENGASFVAPSPYGYTAALYWSREFEDTKPRLQISQQERSSADFARFTEEYDGDPADTGIAFIYDAWRENRYWYALEQSDPTLWGSSFLHLAGVSRFVVAEQYQRRELRKLPWIGNLARSVIGFLPEQRREELRRRLRTLLFSGEMRRMPHTPREKSAQVRALMSDPEAFLRPILALAEREQAERQDT